MEQKNHLDAFTKPMANQVTEKYDPMESISTFSFGGEIKEGTMICGKFVETQQLASPKFKSQERNEKGIPVQYRHILEREDGCKIGLWTTGELKLGFSRINPGQYVELTYLGKKEINDQVQHAFDWKIGSNSH